MPMLSSFRLPIFGMVLLLAAGAVMGLTPEPAIGPTTEPIETAGESSAPDTVLGATSVQSGQRGALIPITGEISNVTFESIKRRVEQAREDGVGVILFEIHTPGGAAMAAIEICDFIKNLTDIHTVAWVHTQAISAGSMIALSCDELVMSPASSIGDCGVLMASPMGAEAVPEELRAKAESPVLAVFRDSANRFGYSKALCESLVVKERVVWWLENARTGLSEFVDDEEKVRRMGGAARNAARPADAQAAKDDADESSDEANSGRDATNAVEQTADSEWRFVESYVDAFTGREVTVYQPIVDENELLTMSQGEAMAYGFGKGIVGQKDEFVARYSLAGAIDVIEFTWSEVMVRYLTSMPVRIFLMVLIMLGAYVEFNTPGLGIPGAAALICLIIFVGAPYLTGLAGAVELVLIVLGILLLLVELFILPGFGIAGVGGVLLVLIGVFMTFIPAEPGPWRFVPQMQGTWDAIQSALISMMAAFFIAGGCMWYLSRLLPQTTLGKRLMLDSEHVRVATVQANQPVARMPELELGDRGLTLSALRPAGRARLRGRQYDVVTEGDMISEGATVQVVAVAGNRVVVREIAPDDAAKA